MITRRAKRIFVFLYIVLALGILLLAANGAIQT